MSETAAEIAKKYAGKAGKTFQSVSEAPKPEIDPAEKAKLANTALQTTKFLSQEAYFNPDKINDYGRRDAGQEVELFDPDTRIPVARIAREPKSGGPSIWQSSSYNPDLDYQQVAKEGYISLVDPQTGREAARTANLVGGADDGEIPPTKPPAPSDGTGGGGDIPPSEPPAPPSPEDEGNNERISKMDAEDLAMEVSRFKKKLKEEIDRKFAVSEMAIRTEMQPYENEYNRRLGEITPESFVETVQELVEAKIAAETGGTVDAEFIELRERQLKNRNNRHNDDPRHQDLIADYYANELRAARAELASSPTKISPEPPTVPPAGPPPPDDRRDDGSPDGGVPPTAPATETVPETSPASTETFATLQSKIEAILRARSTLGVLTPGGLKVLEMFQLEQSEILERYTRNPEVKDLIDAAQSAINAYIVDEVNNMVRTAEPISDPAHITQREDMLQLYLDKYPKLNGYLRYLYNEGLKSRVSRYRAEIDNKRTTIENEKREISDREASEATRRREEETEAQERRHREQIEAIEANRKAISAKEYPHDEFLSNPNPTVRREYIENLLFDYEHFSNGITAGDIAKLKEAMTRLKLDKELIDVLDARKALQEAAGHVPIEGSMNIDEWEKSMKGLFVAEGYPLKLLIGGDWVDKVTKEKISDKDLDIIAADLQRPPHERRLEWKKKELIPGLSEALTLLQTETHQETMEVDKIDFSTSPPRFIPDQKIKLTVTCNFVQGDSSQANVSRVKKIYEEKLKARLSGLDDKKIETAIHLAERLLRVTLVSAKMNGPLQMNHAIEVQKVVDGRPAVRTDGKEDTKTVEDYRIAANLDLASRRIKLSLNLANNTPKLVNGVSQSSEWDTIYDGSHPTIKIDTSASMAGVIKGRGSGLRESLYFPSFLEQRDLGGYPELRRLANLRVADLLPHFSEQAKNILVDDPVTGTKNKPGEVTDFDTFIKIYSSYSFGNKQNVLYFWVDNVKNAMDKRSLFYSDPKESGKSVTGLVADPVSFSTREKIIDSSLDFIATRDDSEKVHHEEKQALEKYLKSLVDLGNEFASKYVVAFSGLPKEKVNQLIWLEQQFIQFFGREDIGKKYFKHRSIKARGRDLYFYFGPKAMRAFQYGFYKSEIIQNINQEADPIIYALAETTIQTSDPTKESTGSNFLTNASNPVNIFLKALSGNYKPDKK